MIKQTAMTDTEQREISNTIIEQLGGGMFRMMTGAKQFTYGGTTTRFRIGRNGKGVNMVSVTLAPSDTYSVEFLWATVKGTTVRSSYTDVYAEDLRGVFETATGLYTRISTIV